jgi:hypothetical protein
MSLILSGTDGLSDVDGSAATPAIRGTDANTGIFFGADIIGFSEGGVEAARIDSSANLQFNSGYGSVATAYGCRAWVNFKGTDVVTIRASGNVSSITDNGTGDYTVNFATAMPDINYAAFASSDSNPVNVAQLASVNYKGTGGYATVAPTTTAFRFFISTAGGTAYDQTYVNASAFR